MQNLKDKLKISTIAIILVLAISSILVALPVVNAQQSKATIAYLGAMPNPVGVGQEVLLHVGITDSLSSAEMGFEGLMVEVTAPDGSSDELGPFRTDSTGGTGGIFIPTMAGTYTLRTHFPEQTILVTPFFFGMPYNLTYLESYSDDLVLEVLEDPIAYYPDDPLPSEYWTRPIDAQLRSWSAISGSWVRDPDNLYAPYNDGPETAHILWTTQLDCVGGLAGGELGGLSYGIGDAYEGKWSTRLIIDGMLYYETGGARTETLALTHCVDLHTGEELWSKVFMDNQSISFGQIFYWDGMNYHGAFPYLFVSTGGNYYAFDAYTGDWRFTVENVPSGTTLYDELNHIYILDVDTTNNWMALWDMTASCLQDASGYSAGSWGNSVHGGIFDAEANTTGAQSAWIWNVTIPSGLEGSMLQASFGDRAIGGTCSQEGVTLWGLSLEDGDEGDIIFNNTWDAPAYWSEMNLTVSTSAFNGGFEAWSFEDKVVCLNTKELRENFGFSLETGEYLWGPTPSEHYLNALEDSRSYISNIAYGNLYVASVSGIVYCYDVQTGDTVWTYEVNDPYSEMLWSNNWWVKPLFITDGKIYISHTEHSPVDPRPRGAPFVCLDALTGDVIFRIDGAFRTTRWGGRGMIADSIIALMDTYDQTVYAIGKGPTELTVDAPDSGVTVGSSATITGTVLDVSPGLDDAAIAARFPNGVPAISDADMSEWMKYVYKQFERPADAMGVTVTIEAVDGNGNYQLLGTTTSDAYGNFAFSYEPEVEGQHMIIATFAGSGAYYGSTSTAYFTADPAPAATPATPIEPEPEPTETEPTPTETEPAPSEPEPEVPMISTEVLIVAVVAVAAVIGVAAFWALRRRG